MMARLPPNAPWQHPTINLRKLAESNVAEKSFALQRYFIL
jgi:hypothetical protein